MRRAKFVASLFQVGPFGGPRNIPARAFIERLAGIRFVR
jgi:hypothetical protein